MMSVLIVTIVAPALFARDDHAIRGLRRTLLFLVVFNLLYLGYVSVIHTTFFVPPAWNW